MAVRHSTHNVRPLLSSFFFFNDTATTEIYTLSLHDALPILTSGPILPALINLAASCQRASEQICEPTWKTRPVFLDRKSTRLNSSHGYISYAVFCLKKKNTPAPATPNTCARRPAWHKSPSSI